MARGWSLICDWTLRIFSHLFPSPERGVGLEMEFIIDGASVRKPPQKSREYVVWRASGPRTGMARLSSVGTEAPVLARPSWTSPYVSLHLGLH